MRFWLGTHQTNWLATAGVPLMVSRRRLALRRALPRAAGPWVLDSGGFTELSMLGAWTVTPETYIREVARYRDEIGGLVWAAPQDWMCEPFITAKTGLTVAAHQARTVDNFVDLRGELGTLVIPVLQGYTVDEYQHCVDLYDAAGIDLTTEPVVGIGSVCRRQNTSEIEHVLSTISGRIGNRLHGFGVKGSGLQRYGWLLKSADSLAWSYNARRHPPIAGHSHQSCANCLEWALRWRERVLNPDRPSLFWRAS